MLSVTDLRAGTAFEMDGQPWVVVKYEHIKMGRGTATIKVKVRNLKTGAVVEKSFINNARVEEVITQKRLLQYLYRDNQSFVFMDPRSFEQFVLPQELLGEQASYLKEGITVNVAFLEEGEEMVPLGVELPTKMEFIVAQTDPGVKGDSAVNIYKPAKLETGLAIKVPLFVNEGEKIIVDTRTGEYVGRAALTP